MFSNLGERRVLIGFGVAGLALLLYPLLTNWLSLSNFWLTLVYQIFVWTTLAVSWNFFSGYSGYSSFGHGAFYGVGMYTASTLMVQHQVPFLLTLPIAGLTAALVALVIGIVIFRLPQFRGEIFSLLTLALTFVVATIVTNLEYLDGGRGVFLSNLEQARFTGNLRVGLYYVALVIAFGTVYLGYYIYNSRWGQALFAIRDDEDVAEGLGVPTFRYKVGTFAVSSFAVGMIGGTQSVFLGYIEAANVFAILTPLLALMMAILGGSGVWYGPIIGAVLITTLRQTLTSGDTAVINQIIIGCVLIFVILFVPEGIAGYIERWRRRFRNKAAKPEPQAEGSAA